MQQMIMLFGFRPTQSDHNMPNMLQNSTNPIQHAHLLQHPGLVSTGMRNWSPILRQLARPYQRQKQLTDGHCCYPLIIMLHVFQLENTTGAKLPRSLPVPKKGTTLTWCSRDQQMMVALRLERLLLNVPV